MIFETGAVAAVPLKPKPVVFDIGGRRFRVDVLTRVANALVVAVTGTGSSGAGRLPYTRRELLIRIAMRMWSPYAEAILQEVSVGTTKKMLFFQIVDKRVKLCHLYNSVVIIVIVIFY